MKFSFAKLAGAVATLIIFGKASALAISAREITGTSPGIGVGALQQIDGVLGADGSVAFVGQSNSDPSISSGLWLNGPNGNTSLLASVGTQIDGLANGEILESVSQLEIDRDDIVTFSGYINQQNFNFWSNNLAIWRAQSTSGTALIARSFLPNSRLLTFDAPNGAFAVNGDGRLFFVDDQDVGYVADVTLSQPVPVAQFNTSSVENQQPTFNSAFPSTIRMNQTGDIAFLTDPLGAARREISRIPSCCSRRFWRGLRPPPEEG